MSAVIHLARICGKLTRLDSMEALSGVALVALLRRGADVYVVQGGGREPWFSGGCANGMKLLLSRELERLDER